MDVLEKTATLNVTEAALNTVRDLLVQKEVPDYGLRVFVSGGGCSGLQYGMALDAAPGEHDHVIELEDVKIFIDPSSMMYMDGATIDYEDSIMGGGFKIDNPQAVSSCGCGTSFKTEDSNGAAAGASCGTGGGCSC